MTSSLWFPPFPFIYPCKGNCFSIKCSLLEVGKVGEQSFVCANLRLVLNSCAPAGFNSLARLESPWLNLNCWPASTWNYHVITVFLQTQPKHTNLNLTYEPFHQLMKSGQTHFKLPPRCPVLKCKWIPLIKNLFAIAAIHLKVSIPPTFLLQRCFSSESQPPAWCMARHSGAPLPPCHEQRCFVIGFDSKSY